MSLLKLPSHIEDRDPVFVDPREIVAIAPTGLGATTVVLRAGHVLSVGLSTEDVEKSVRVALDLLDELCTESTD